MTQNDVIYRSYLGRTHPFVKPPSLRPIPQCAVMALCLGRA